MKQEYESPYLPPLGSAKLPDFLMSRTSDIIAGYQALADLIEWNLLHDEQTGQQQDELLSELLQVKRLVAHFEDQAEQLRVLYAKPEIFHGYHNMLLEMRKTEPLQPKNG